MLDVLTQHAQVWPHDAGVVQMWAARVVPRWPNAALQAAQACTASARAHLWVVLASTQIQPEHPVTMALRRSVKVGARLLAAVKATALPLVRAEVDAMAQGKGRPSKQEVQEVVLEAIARDQVEPVELLAPWVNLKDVRVLAGVMARLGHPLWAIVKPHLNTTGWHEAAEQAIHVAFLTHAGPEPQVDNQDIFVEALDHICAGPRPGWLTQVDLLLQSAMAYENEAAQQSLMGRLEPDDLMPHSLSMARHLKRPDQVTKLLPRTPEGWEAWRRALVRGSQADWPAVDALVDLAPSDILAKWSRKYGPRLPRIQARLRDMAGALKAPETAPRRPRQRA